MSETAFTGELNDQTTQAASSRLTVRWALKRALIGTAILFVSIAGAAWLLHATIKPDAAANTAPPNVPHVSINN